MPQSSSGAAGGAEPNGRPGLSVSIVVFRPDVALLEATLASLRQAIARARGAFDTAELTLVDNGEDRGSDPAALQAVARTLDEAGVATRVLAGHGNVGYGSGHNLALDRVGRLHLVLNPDVEIAPDALAAATAFMQAHPDCGLLSPAAFGPDGTRQFLCKRYPTVLDLLLRGFAPQALRRRFAVRLDRYEMRDAIGDAVAWDPPIVSGCFMLFRGSVFRELGGFDPRFFLYFEDFDLSLRAGRIARLAYVPTVRIVHHGGDAARKGLRHVGMFARSAFAFFSKHGWAWW